MEKTSKFGLGGLSSLSSLWAKHKLPISVGLGATAALGGGAYGLHKAKQSIQDTITGTLNDPNTQKRINELASSGASSALQSLSDQIFTLPNMGKIMGIGALATLPSMFIGAASQRSPNITVNERDSNYRSRYNQQNQNKPSFNPRDYYSYRAR